MELRKINIRDAFPQWEYTAALPADENGLTNPFHGVSFDEYTEKVLPALISYEHPVNMPDWFVPETYYYLWDGDRLIGEFRIRHHLTEALRNGAGHIGYSVRKDARGKGYGTVGLRLTIKIAADIIREDEIYLRVNKDNIASQKVMLHNGASITGEDEDHFFMRIPKRGSDPKDPGLFIRDEKGTLIEYSGPVSVPMERESDAIRSAPAYDKNEAKKYIPLMPEIRKQADEIRDEDGLTAFGSVRPSGEALEQLAAEIQRLSADGHKVSLIMMDLRTRSGVAYHSSVPMCTQSTIKAIYVGALLESRPEALAENGQYMHDAIVYSSNAGYENLRSIYGREPIRKWCAEAGVDPGMAGPNYPRDKSARDMIKLWTRLYCFLNGEADRTNFGAYYADSLASASAKQLPVPVQTKAGWENGLGDHRPFELWQIPERFRDGDPLNDECAINDTGIVYSETGPYIFVIYTDHPFAVLDEEMENPLNSLVKLLYRVHESLSGQ